MKYRKKPVVIDAWYFNGSEIANEGTPSWVQDAALWKPAEYGWQGFLLIKTLEGDMAANAGDYIIRGIKGEVYPCKPDIFMATYEPVES